MTVIHEAQWSAAGGEGKGRRGSEVTKAALLGIAAAAALMLVVLPLQAQAQNEIVLYAFTGSVTSGPDGSYPGAPLLRDAKGNLFGTTESGGDSGDGTVFELVYISPGKYQEQVLYSFKGITTTEPSTQDGADPMAGLIMDAKGNLYGTTAIGGVAVGCTNLGGCGTVFELHYPASPGQGYIPEILHNFGGNLNLDGYQPYAGLVMDSSGNLYGTTLLGGSSGFGTVFEISSSGTYSLLHTFAANSSDGGLPYAGLVMDGSGNLYGTASLGGVSNQGTVFELANSSGNFTYNTLYSFKLNGDGQAPIAGVIVDASGNIFGTTQFGGTSKACGTKLGCGTVFELVYSPPSPPATSGNYTEMLLHTFTGLTTGDGGTPLGLVMDSSGNLYGATEIGGGSTNTCVYGCGTLFELVYSPPSPPSTTGSYTETVLYSFPTSSGDGLVPNAALIIDSSDNLYGVTTNGGYTTPSGGGVLTACPFGCGTVFEYTPSPGAYAQYSTIGPINFGSVDVGSTATQQLALVNTGGTSFDVDSISLTGSSTAFTLTNALCNGMTDFPFTATVTLAPKQTCTFTLQFAPTVQATGQGELLTVATTTTNSNASPGAGGAGQAFLLAGDGVEPFASYSPLQLSFGNVTLNTPATQTVTVTDTGTGPLVLQLAEISALGTGFSYTQVVCNAVVEPSPTPFPLTITPGNSCTFTVQFDPTVSGAASGGLGFADNAGVGESNLTSTSINGTTFQQNVPFSGTGVTAMIATKTTFTASSKFHGQTLPAGVALVGNPVTVNVTVNPASGTASPTGTVLIDDGGLNDTCAPSPTPLTAGAGTCILTIMTFPVGGLTSLGAAYTPVANSGFLASTALRADESVVEGVVPCGAAVAPVTVHQKASVTETFTVCLAANLNLSGVPLAIRVTECLPFGFCTVQITPDPNNPGVYVVSVTITTYDNGNGTAWLPAPPPQGGPGRWPPTPFAFGALLILLIGLQLTRQNRGRARLLYTAGLLFALVLSGMSGCGSSANQNVTPVGTYTLNAQVTAGGVFSATVPLAVTVTK